MKYGGTTDFRIVGGKGFALKLPNGVEDGTQMRLKGKGEQGPGGPGDDRGYRHQDRG